MPDTAVLFVCAANRCRSPLAAARLRQLLAQHAAPGVWRVESAGLYAQTGQPATPPTQTVAAEYGLDLTDHRSRPLDAMTLDEFAWIVVMEEIQADALRAAYPPLASAVHTLGRLAGLPADVADPTGHSLAEHRAAYRQMDRYLRAALLQMLKTAHAGAE